jgi:hypothetical protein
MMNREIIVEEVVINAASISSESQRIPCQVFEKKDVLLLCATRTTIEMTIAFWRVDKTGKKQRGLIFVRTLLRNTVDTSSMY